MPLTARLYWRANEASDAPSAARFLIARTCSSESVIPRLCTPFLRPAADLFLSVRSLIFSTLVPRNRCPGLQHRRLSHLWHTHRPSGASFSEYTRAIRCALHCLLLSLKRPYPSLSLVDNQGQHASAPPVLSTLPQNTVASFRFIPTKVPHQ